MRQDVYRVALDEASSELNDILARFDQLRRRKDRLEKIVEALKPLVASNDQRSVAAVEASAVKPVAIPESEASAPIPVPTPAMSHVQIERIQAAADESADPFDRRVENVMGMSSATRDVREYSRLFNSTSSR
jgi:hypothetical protein